MMTIVDILIYVAFAFFASSLAKKSDKHIEVNDISPSRWDKYLTYFVLFFTVIGGIRWSVGGDSISYAVIFNTAYTDPDSKEAIWYAIVNWFHDWGLHWTLGLALCAFLQIFFITKALQPYRWLLIFMPFVFFGGRYWMDCMNAVRQMMVGCCFLWAIKYIYDKKIIFYAIFVLAGALIHQSALILLPFYFMPKKLNLAEHRWLLIAVFLVCVAIGQVAKMSGLSEYVQMIAGATDYHRYEDSMAEMLSSGYDEEKLSFGPMMLTYLLIPLFTLSFGPELKKRFEDKIPYFNLWFNFAFFYACSYFLVCNLGHIFIRPTMYFSLFQMVMASLLLCYLWNDYKEYGLRQITTLAFCFIIALNTCWDVFKASGKSYESSTYKVSFFHKDQQKLFNLR
ncbi:MAG: EpsG family protein [Bacteroides sp.]|nr:EpsG family protein [Alistipes timonensis]MCM1311178.1 EpsG family protein [Bacteroides sp.]MCM1405575.1 EpsG family protein [[Clostridium] fimetarium]